MMRYWLTFLNLQSKTLRLALLIPTFDSDFYDISIINGHPPKIIWIRSGNLKTDEVVQLLTDNKKIISGFIELDEFKDVACLELER